MKIPILSEVHRKIFKLMDDITSYSKNNDKNILSEYLQKIYCITCLKSDNSF